MRRIATIILCCLLLATSVSAAGITTYKSETIAASDGSCEVTLTVTVRLDGPVSELSFPVPDNARNITVNGSGTRSARGDNVRNVDLTKFVSGAGTYTLVMRYSLPDAVTEDNQENLTFTLPLLSGFAYPVEEMSFTVTLPGVVERKPTFTSTYYQEAADTVMDVVIADNVISGNFRVRLQDHESLTMTLPVSEDIFPQSVAKKWSMDTIDLLMIAVAFLAIIYWLISMRFKLPRKHRRATAPEGMNAGEVACRVTGQGVDLTMMVVSWAQMGYLLIQPDDNGRVLLHKRMEMGNERSDFENRYFRSLFGKRKTVDATGYHYARLWDKASKIVLGAQNTYLRSSGNPSVYRVLVAVIGILAGFSLATGFVRDTGWQIVLAIFLGIFTAVASWLIQVGAMRAYGRDKLPLLIALGCAVLWFGISLLAGEWNTAVFVIPAQFLGGLMAAYGGRRTEMGKQDMADLLALRHHLKTVSTGEVKQLLTINPDYYYTLAPYAMALGVDRAFARQMGKTKLAGCTYLTTGMDGHMTAREWNQLLRDTVDSMDAMHKRLPIDKLLGK